MPTFKGMKSFARYSTLSVLTAAPASAAGTQLIAPGEVPTKRAMAAVLSSVRGGGTVFPRKLSWMK